MIVEIRARNFFSIGNICVSGLDKSDLISIVGSYANKPGYSNGSGKSGFAEVILYTLTSKHRYKTDKLIVRIGEDEAATALIILVGNDIVEIERFIKIRGERSSTSALVKLNGEVKASSTTEAQIWINKYFGLTPDDFLSSHFFRQKGYDKFLRTRSGVRLEFLEQFFGAAIFERAKSLWRKKRASLRDKILVMESSIQTLALRVRTARPETVVTKELKEDKAEQKSLKKAIDSLATNMSDVNQDIASEEQKHEREIACAAKVKALTGRVAEVSRKGKSINTELREIDEGIREIQSQKGPIQREIDLLTREAWTKEDEETLSINEGTHERYLIKINVLKNDLEKAERNVKDLEASLCSTCKRPIDDELRRKLLEEVERECSVLIRRVARGGAKVNEVANLVANGRRQKKAMSEIREKATRKQHTLDTLGVRGKADIQLRKARVETRETLLKSVSDMKAEREELAKVTFDESELLRLRKRKNTQRVTLADQESRFRRLGVKINNLEIESKGVRDDRRNEKELNNQLSILRQRDSEGDLLDDIWDKCRYEMLEVGLEELEQYSNLVIDRIGATRKRIIFETEKESQAGKVRNSLDMYLLDEKGKRPIEGLSGGEWDIVSLSIRTALSRYRLARMDSRIDFLVLDEVFSALDESSREELILALRMFQQDFAQVFVVSHTPLKEVFDYTVHLEMGEDHQTQLAG